MRFSLTSLIRLMAMLAVSASAMAVLVSRALPPAEVLRQPAPPRFFGVNGSVFAPPVAETFLLDTKTGDLTRPNADHGESLDYVTCSPWTLADGTHEFIGRLIRWDGSANQAVFAGATLSRFGMEGGSLSDRVDLGAVISGRPCWLPSHPSLLLWAAGNGRIYRQDLSTAGTTIEDEEEPAHHMNRIPLRWACPFPGAIEPLLSDPICPPIPSFRGKLFVSLSTRHNPDVRWPYERPRIWWLELDRDARTIIAAGPLFPSDDVNVDQRLSNYSVGPDGVIRVIFLSHRGGASDWRLNVARVEVDPTGGHPIACVPSSKEIARDVAAVTPPVSPDGRFLYSIRRTYEGRPSITTVDLTQAAPGPKMLASTSESVQPPR